MYWEKEVRFKITTRRIFAGILATMTVFNLVIVGTVLGASSSSPPSSATPTPSITPTSREQPGFIPTGSSGTTTPTIGLTETFTPSPSATSTFTALPTDTLIAASPTPTICIPWSYWFIYRVKVGDTLSAIARMTSSTVHELMQANCLTSSLIYPDQKLYVPRLPIDTSTPTLTESIILTPDITVTYCPQREGWHVYTVQPGDTIYSIANAIKLSPEQLMAANCLTSDVLYPGQPLYVPSRSYMIMPSSTPSPKVLG